MAEARLSLRQADGAALDYVVGQLEAAGLPTADVREKPDRFYIAERAGDRVGAGGLEGFGEVGLLRSVVVEPDARGRGHGSAIVEVLEAEARAAGIETLYLLTETASEFFADRGYTAVDRETAPAAIKGTTEFSDLCSESAVCMRKGL